MILLDGHPVSFQDADDAIEESMSCSDGSLLLTDIARSAHISLRAARRALTALSKSADKGAVATEGGAIVSLDDTVAPRLMTRAQLGAAVAEKFGLGIYGVRQRVAARPVPPPKERSVSVKNHPWKDGQHGRSLRTVEGGHQMATLTCRCGKSHDIGFREVAGADQIDNKFKRAGWRLDPGKCPTCIHKPKETAMSAAPSAAAIRSQAAMFRMLGEHFDIDAGRYAEGWSDERVAKETSVAPAMVAGVREEAFGVIREPEEIAALARDIGSFEGLLTDALEQVRSAVGTMESIRSEHVAMKQRLADIRKRFAA